MTADALEGVVIEGSGDVLLEDLDAQAFDIEVEGAGDLEASGSVDDLRATIEGAGDVTYRGDPVVESEIEGAGDLRQVP